MRATYSPLRYFAYLIIAASLIGAIALYWYCARFEIPPLLPLSYPALGRAFISGHTYLNIPPSPGLLALPNPYNKFARVGIWYIWDASLYHGHYYVYFGPVPAILPWVAVKWLAGISLTDRQIELSFSAVGTAFFVLLLALIARKKQPAISLWGLCFAVIAACFGTAIPQMLHQQGIYVPPICGVYCFNMIGLSCLWQALSTSTRYAGQWKIFGSLCLGLAVGCRMLHALNAVILLAVWLSIKRGDNWRDHLREAAYLAVPWSLCIAALAVYNYVRFGSFLETGLRYQVGGIDFHNGYPQFWSFSNIPRNIYEYFLKPFPPATWFHWQPDFGTRRGGFTVHGLWFNNPFFLWCLWFLPNIRKYKPWFGKAYGLIIGITAYALAMTFFMLLYRYQMNRYMVDFSPWMMLLAVLGYMGALQTSPPRWRPALLAVGGVMALCSVYIDLASCYYAV